MNIGKVLSKIGISFGSSMVVCESVNLEPLWNALITLGISIITILSVDGVAWLKSWLKKKKEETENKDNEPKE